MRRLRNVLAMNARDRWLTLEAAWFLGWASALLAVLPFRVIARRLGALEASPGPHATPEASLRPIGRAVARAARHLPWHPLCLPQAMAAQAMLRRRNIPSTMHFGMALNADDRRMHAHAWLTAGDIGVIGAGGVEDLTVLARFSHRPKGGSM